MRSKGWSESTRQPPSSWVARVRFSAQAPDLNALLAVSEDENNANKPKMSLSERISKAARAFLEVKAQNLPLQLFMSTVDGLGDLFEDEILPTPLPMKVSLNL